MNVCKSEGNRPHRRFTATATEKQLKQMRALKKELRWSRSEIIRLAIELMLETHRKDPKRYGV